MAAAATGGHNPPSASQAETALIEIALRENVDPQQLRAEVHEFIESQVGGEASANELLRKYGRMFSFWVCVMDDDGGVYHSLSSAVVDRFESVGRFASLEAFEHVPLGARVQYVDFVTSKLKSEIQPHGGYSPPPAVLNVLYSLMGSGWFRLNDVVDRALEKEEGLVGTACQLVLDETKNLRPTMMMLCLNTCADVAVNASKRSSGKAFRLALSRGVLRAAICAANHPNAAEPNVLVPHLKLFNILRSMSSLVVKALQQGTATRRLADSVLENGGTNQAKIALRKLLELEELDAIAGARAAQDLSSSGSSTDGSGQKPSTSCKLCRHCSGGPASLKCSKCKEAFYCSKACQTKDWKHHKARCPPLAGTGYVELRGNLANGYILRSLEQLRTDVMTKLSERNSTVTEVDDMFVVPDIMIAVDLDSMSHSVLFVEDVMRWESIPGWITGTASFNKRAFLDEVALKFEKLLELEGMWLIVIRAPGGPGITLAMSTIPHDLFPPSLA